jgi:hypothetical protein
MVRDAVATTQHLTVTGPSCPNTGITGIFNFQQTNALAVLEEARKMGGVNYYFFVDEIGVVWFGNANLAAAATYTIKQSAHYNARKATAPISNLKNVVIGTGAILANATVPISSTYDQSSGSPYGKRALTPPLQYPNLTDQTTLNTIVTTVGTALNRLQTSVDITLPQFGQRIMLSSATGTTLRYWEPSTNPLNQSSVGTGTYSPNYVVQQVEWDGPTQRIVVKDIAISVDDLKYEIDRMVQRNTTAGIQSIYPITPGQVSGGTTGGPNTPSAVAWVSASWSTGVDNTSQTATPDQSQGNAFIIVAWTANANNENIARWEIKYRKVGDTVYTVANVGPVAGGTMFYKFAKLIQGVNYGFQIRAVNSLGVAGVWSVSGTDQTQIAALDAVAPAVPTGLAAVKTPRGALVSWTANTEQDLQGYGLQVSIGGGAYAPVFDKTLITSFAYVAPSGTATGTSLQFQVRSVDWSGNYSAFSAASAAVNTDGIVFDELLAGNLKVFGTVTTGSLQTAASGARWVVDSTSIRAYDSSNTDYGAPSGVGVTFEIQRTGSAFFQGTVSASKVYASTIATSALMGQIGAGPGYKLTGQFLDFYTVASIVQGTRFWFAPDNVTPFGLAGVLAAGLMTFAKGAADSDTETITTSSGPIIASALVIASFKPNTTIAKVGSAGAFTSTPGGSVTPPFGQATTSGNLLVAWVACNAATPPSITTQTGALATPVNSAFTQGTGTLAAGTYFYRVTATNSFGETLPSVETSLTIAASTGVNVNWGAVAGATGYKVYGRSSGAELLIATLGNVTTFLDNGSVTPAGAMPTVNTTSPWLKAIAANATNVESDIWYRANCGASEAAPTFTATLVAPSSADSLTETITDSGGGAQIASVANMAMASFTPTSSSVPAALVRAGAFTTGTNVETDPTFGQPTTAGNLLVAWVSGNQGVTGGGTANLGATAAATYGNNFAGGGGANADNQVFMGPFTIPQHGTFTQLSVYMGSNGGSTTTQLVLWDVNGNVAGYSNAFTASGLALQTQALTASVDAPSGSQWYIGFYRAVSGSAQWGVTNGGSFKYITNLGSSPATISGYSNCNPVFFCGNMQAYAQYTIVVPSGQSQQPLLVGLRPPML